MKAALILDAIDAVTRKWTKTIKAEERDRQRVWRRREELVRPHRETIKDVAWESMPAAYAKASANGTLPAHARQIMYAARGEIQQRTGRTLDDQYFCQVLLPDYITAHGDAQSWNVVFDARGHFAEPHTEKIVALGTLDVRHYLHAVISHEVEDPKIDLDSAGKTDYPTCGPKARFSAVLFIEKEGFLPLFEAVRLAERYDLAIMSTKGMSSTASRELVDDLCGAGDGGARIPLLVLHDFDKAGFSILGTLQRDTRRYEFNSHPEVVDLGLRLADIQAHGLMPELVSYGKSDPTWNLGENGATPEEIRFLSSTHDHRGYSGQRVELNAFPSDQLIAWIEGKLQAHGMNKVIPDETTLRAAFRRAVHLAYLRAQLEALEEDAEEAAKTAKFPKTLRPRIRQRFERDPAVSWDRVVRELADAAVEDLDEEVGE